MLAGLGYAVINAALPNRLWTRASALVSAMWGVSVIIGPAMGGVFAQLGIWRWAFGSLAIATVAMAALVPGALPSRDKTDLAPAALTRIPVWSLLLLGAAALAISVAGVQRTAVATAGLLALGVALVGCFLVIDRRAGATVLPRAAFGPGPLKWMYVTIGCADGRHDGRHVRAAVRSAARGHGPGGRRVPRRGAGGRAGRCPRSRARR